MAITDNLQQKIERARAAGYSDEQIRTYLGSQGIKIPETSGDVVSRVKEAFNTRVDRAATAQTTDQSIASKALQTAGQAAGFVGDVAFEAVKTVVPERIENTIAAGAQKIAEAEPVQRAASAYNAWKAEHPEAAANLEAIGSIASILPVGKAASVAGKTAATGAGKAISTTGKTVASTGQATQAAGKFLHSTGFTPTVKEAERILTFEANNPLLKRASAAARGETLKGAPRLRSDTAFDYAIQGTEKSLGVQAKRSADQLWKETIAPAVKSSPAVMTKEELFAPARTLVEQTVDPTRKKALQHALEALEDDYADVTDWTLDQAQALKRDLDTFTPAKVFRGQDVASEVRTLQHEMADAIRQKTYAALEDVNVKKQYLDWANLHELEKIGVKAISEAGFKGGFGGFWSSMWDMTTTPIKTVGGRTLYRVGSAFEFVGDKGIKRFGDFLQRQGFQRPKSSK